MCSIGLHKDALEHVLSAFTAPFSIDAYPTSLEEKAMWFNLNLYTSYVLYYIYYYVYILLCYQ